jgi:Guanylate-binding protein, N-terminal domain
VCAWFVPQPLYPHPVHHCLPLPENLLQWSDALSELPSDAELVVVGCVGPARSGKSFLLNQLISGASHTEGFEVGPLVSPTTKGIWVLREPLLLREATLTQPARYLMLVDTEGFYARDVSEEYDAKIFSVATLLSSVLVYNSVKTIDQAAIEYLELLARRTQLFRLKTELHFSDQPASALLNFPALLYVLSLSLSRYLSVYVPIGVFTVSSYLYSSLCVYASISICIYRSCTLATANKLTNHTLTRTYTNHTYTHIHTHMQKHTHTYTHTHTHIHTKTHTHTHTLDPTYMTTDGW